MPGAAELRQLRLQLGDLGTHDELAVSQYRVQPSPQLRRDARLLRLQVEEWQVGALGVGHAELTLGPGSDNGIRQRDQARASPALPSALCSNSGTSRPRSVNARRTWPPRQAVAISSMARPM